MWCMHEWMLKLSWSSKDGDHLGGCFAWEDNEISSVHALIIFCVLHATFTAFRSRINSDRYPVGGFHNPCIIGGTSQVSQVVKTPPTNVGDAREAGSIPGSGRSPGGGHGNPLQYSCLENPMDRGAWRAIVHDIAKSQTWLYAHMCCRWGLRDSETIGSLSEAPSFLGGSGVVRLWIWYSFYCVMLNIEPCLLSVFNSMFISSKPGSKFY